MQHSRLSKQHRNMILGAALLLLLIIWAGWCYSAFRNMSDPKNEAMVERQSWYELEIDGAPVLYFAKTDSDSTLASLSEKRDTAITRTLAPAHWTNRMWWLPSCNGRLSAMLDTLPQPSFSPAEIVDLNLKIAEKRLKDLDTMSDEMEYYFSVHSVQDEGYELVTDFYEKTIRQISDLSGVIAQLKRCQQAKALSVSHKALYRAVYDGEAGKKQADTCVLVRQKPHHPYKGNGLLSTLQLESKHTPSGIKPASCFSDANIPSLTYKVLPRYEEREDTLHGLALRVTPEKGVQIGHWEKGKFKGEQMEYNSQRIYGIDISRFQHEKGRRRYSIQWDKLRITSLGSLSKKKIAGTVDYPVSFCYIKATEGVSIKNKYYSSDYVQARKHGLKVGNYHFFSTKSPALRQAQWYLSHSRYQKGDLPPVLDVEPSAAQIRAMGGPEKLFAAVRVWLKTVEAKTGVRPILYISQTLVNKYLPYAPDLKKDYQVWIARYGEYKPDVHMLYWQLSPDGRVRGIVPEVDINVFNGYEQKYQQFIEKL